MTQSRAASSERRRLELALQAAGLGEFQWDLGCNLMRISPRMSAITGMETGELRGGIGDGVESHVHPDDLEAFRTARAASLQSGETFDIRFRLIRATDQRIIWLRLAGIISRDAAGAPLSVTGIVEDVSASHLDEQRSRQLAAELDHRVKNVLASVQALVRQTAKRTTSLPSFLQTFGGRLKAMASSYELLTAARWRGAAIDHLAAAELGALAPGQTSWEGPDLFLTPRAANTLALALHELASNAVKFGALSGDGGRVDLRWTLLPKGGFELTWRESGGPTVTPPLHKGFGSALLDQVTGRELNGDTRVDYRPDGIRVRLRAGPQAVAERPAVTPPAPLIQPSENTPNGAPANLKGVRVLVVEDAVLLAMELESGLLDAGAIVIGPAYELEEALGLLDQPIDAAVLDANLNGRSVTPVAEALSRRNVPFVFATGHGNAGAAPIGFAAPVIRKPYDVTQVTAAVAELIAAQAPATRTH